MEQGEPAPIYLERVMSRQITRISVLPLIAVVSTLVFSQSTLAAWTLNSSDSRFFYVTSKSSAVSEINNFGELKGNINDQGEASLQITLASVDTNIDIRNERMRNIVFEIADYPLATVNMAVDNTLLANLSAGESLVQEFQASVGLHGQEQDVAALMQIVKNEEGGLIVTLARPLLINAALFGLASGVEELREIAKLPSINHNVIVDFTLQFDLVD
jgi:hypothetical protein